MIKDPSEPEWAKYRIGKLSSIPDHVNFDCQPLEEVYHVSHINQGWSIIESGVIKSQLVYDKSKLNTMRTQVTWFSPNRWDHGFLYGNISFEINWKDLILSKNSYWVERKNYSPPASRILLSDKDYSASLLPYDPKVGDGPWWYDASTDLHYWNGVKHCLEIMVESDITLSEINGLNFVDHHNVHCSNKAGKCLDKTIGKAKAGVYFLAGIIGRGIIAPPSSLFVSQKDKKRHFNVTAAENFLLSKLDTYCKKPSATDLSHDESAAVARAIFAAIARRDEEEAMALGNLFSDQNIMLQACFDLFEKHFGWSLDGFY